MAVSWRAGLNEGPSQKKLDVAFRANQRALSLRNAEVNA
jgi:hypothetical protein